MAGRNFPLPKVDNSRHGEGKPPALPVREVPPPLPGRQSVLAAPFVTGTKVQQRSSFSGNQSVNSHALHAPPVVQLQVKKKVLLNLDSKDVDEDVLQRSQLANLVTVKALPVIVKLKRKTHSPGCSVELTEGSLIHLHFLHKTTRIYATDSLGKDIYLPKYANQQYTVLPIDPIHDDKLYPTTEALINARPLPMRVRIEEAHFSDHPGEAQEAGDIIEITGIEKRPVPADSDNPPQKCLIGTCNNIPIAFSESMDCASYSTMPSIDFMSMSEVVNKFPLPLRIRRADKPDEVMILHRIDEEYHVIATCDKFDHVLSIPISWNGEIEAIENPAVDPHLQRLLPPLYPVVNPTWGAREPGRRDLQPSMQMVPQPPTEILEPWSRTKEGQDFLLKGTKTSVDSYKLRIEELMEEKTRLNNELKIYRCSRPPAPLPRDSSVPLLPPRPSMPRSPSPSPGHRGDDDDDDDDDAYEEPMPTPPNKGKSHIPASKELEEIKVLLQEREMKIKQLQDKQLRLKQENTDLHKNNASLTDTIRDLQNKLDKLEADPMYDSLKTGNYAYPTTGPIYSQGGGGGMPVAERGLKNYNEDGVAGLLREMKLEAHVPKFKENSINGELLCDLDEEDLYGEIGMSRIQAKRLMIEVRKRAKKS